jgi:curved DNA-binding protein CbpA
VADDISSAARISEWDQVLDDSSYYEILGVLDLADDQAIRQAFRAFALAFHPDGHLDENDDVLAVVRRIYQRGVEAYRVLIDPERRVHYDMGLKKGELRLADRPSRRPPADGTPGRPLDELCRSAGAKLAAKKADKLLSEGHLVSAKSELEKALEFDGGVNPDLTARIEDLELALYAMGAD